MARTARDVVFVGGVRTPFGKAGPTGLDLCLILGAGWPFHLGGITPYLDRTGVAGKVNGARFRS